MKSGRCPKCQSTDIRIGPTGTTRDLMMNVFSVSFWRKVTPERHVCVSCGYMEQYVSDPVDRRAIAEKWPGRSV
jgi:predicted nucleic-acid-binding Zn-ribbon protein